jgi:hypothetical protein
MKKVTLFGIAAVLACNGLAFGQDWDEIGNGGGDAGDLPGTAQVVLGSGPLSNIFGTTSANDLVDMYFIRIIDPVNFMAHTDPTGGGWASFDTQLWLFDAAGLGMLANDDKPGGSGFRSWLSLPADDGTMNVLPGVGNYYIAISGYNNDARSAGGEIFFTLSFQEMSGPDGVGAGSPVNSWTGGGASGQYQIHLVGAEFIPAPGAMALLGLGGLLARRRRRR